MGCQNGDRSDIEESLDMKIAGVRIITSLAARNFMRFKSIVRKSFRSASLVIKIEELKLVGHSLLNVSDHYCLAALSFGAQAVPRPKKLKT